MPAEWVIEKVLETEAEMPLAYRRRRHYLAKKAAVLALLADEDLSGPDRFQYLAEVETGKTSVSGFASHKDVISKLREDDKERIPTDGLFLRLDWTEPDHDQHRLFIGATPYKVDKKAPSFFKFEPGPGLTRPDGQSTLLTDDSGLYYRYSTDAANFLHQSRPRQQGFRVYGVYTAEEDKTAWVPFAGYGWPGSQYPGRGPYVARGQHEITELVTRLFAYGGAQLERVQEGVGEFPGFGFIHDIRPERNDKKDADELAPRVSETSEGS